MAIISRISLAMLLVAHLPALPSIASARPVAGVTGTDAQAGPRSEEVRISSDPGVVLAGQLRLPATPLEARHPVVLLLGGGGPAPHGIYPLLEERLLANGIATLSYDKRGVGKSTGAFIDTIALMQRDAAAAIAYLRARDDIDSRRIVVLGLSQGGTIGQALVGNDPALHALVMLAAPAGKRSVMILDTMRAKLTSSGMRNDAIDPIVAATRGYLDAMSATASDTAIAAARGALSDAFVAAGGSRAQAEGAIATLGDPALVSMYQVAADEMLARVKAPVLALYAADDTVVLTRLAMPDARLALRHNPDATVIEVPDVNHGSQPLATGTTGKRDYQGWPVSDPETLDLVDRWLARRLAAPARE